MATPLDLAEVKRRLALYTDSKVTDELYSFGESLVTSAVDYLAKLDAKASTVTTYAGGLLTVVVSTSPFWGRFVTTPSLVLLILAALGLVLTGVFAAQSMNLKTSQWYSDNDWLREPVLGNVEDLRRYRVLTMWTVRDSHRRAAAQKLAALKKAIRVLYGALAVLAIAVALIAANAIALQGTDGQESHITVGDD